MFERFTDRARKVMAIANQEAMHFQHEFIGTEHILLGLLRDGAGAGAEALKNLNVDIGKLKLDVTRVLKPGADTPQRGKQPQTPRAKKVIEYAVEEARRLGHKHIGTEHLLLGLLREDEGVASIVLRSAGVELTRVRDEILNLYAKDLRKADSHSPGDEPEPATSKEEQIQNLLFFDSHLADLAILKDELVTRNDYEKAADVRDQALAVNYYKTKAIDCILATRPPMRGKKASDDDFHVIVIASILANIAKTCPELLRRFPEAVDAIRRHAE